MSIEAGKINYNQPEKKPLVPQRESLVQSLRTFGTKVLPHDTTTTTCPPAALVSGQGPLIIVASIMRSGTHLLLDSLFNNFPALQRTPLFIDFDAYERQSLPLPPFANLQGAIIKTHFPHTPLAEPYAATLAKLAARAFILTPQREAESVRKSLAKWDQVHSVEEFAGIRGRFDAFWAPFSPLTVDFRTLLDPAGVERLMQQVAQRTDFKPFPGKRPVMPATSRTGIYCDKMLTRIFGRRAPRVNTTIGYRLKPKQRA